MAENENTLVSEPGSNQKQQLKAIATLSREIIQRTALGAVNGALNIKD